MVSIYATMTLRTTEQNTNKTQMYETKINMLNKNYTFISAMKTYTTNISFDHLHSIACDIITASKT